MKKGWVFPLGFLVPIAIAYQHRKSKGLKLTKVKILSFAFGIKANSEGGKMQRFDLLMPYMIMMLFEFLNVGHEFAFFQNI